MKKVLLVVLICSVCCSVMALTVGTGNDLFSMGINDNYDDQLSFNTFVNFDFDKFDLDVTMDSYTKRYSNRIDVLSIVASKTLANGSFTAVPHAGLSVAGNLYFESAQNVLHNVINIPTVVINYDFDKAIFPLLGADISYGKQFQLKVSGTDIIGLYYDLFAGCEFNLSKSILFGAGYRYFDATEKSPTLCDFERYSRGFETYMKIDGGFVSFEHYNCFANGFGFGTLSFDLEALKKDISIDFSRTSFESCYDFDMGYRYFFNMGEAMPKYRTVRLERNLKGNNAFYVENVYESGASIMLDSDFEDEVRTTKRNIRHYCFTTVGLSHEFECSRFFVPSVNLGTGLMYCEHKRLNYQNVEVPVEIEKNKSIGFIMDGQIDVRILPSGVLKIADSSYDIDLVAGCYFVPFNEKLSAVVGSDSSLCHVEKLVPYCGFALTIGLE